MNYEYNKDMQRVAYNEIYNMFKNAKSIPELTVAVQKSEGIMKANHLDVIQQGDLERHGRNMMNNIMQIERSFEYEVKNNRKSL